MFVLSPLPARRSTADNEQHTQSPGSSDDRKQAAICLAEDFTPDDIQLIRHPLLPEWNGVDQWETDEIRTIRIDVLNALDRTPFTVDPLEVDVRRAVPQPGASLERRIPHKGGFVTRDNAHYALADPDAMEATLRACPNYSDGKHWASKMGGVFDDIYRRSQSPTVSSLLEMMTCQTLHFSSFAGQRRGESVSLHPVQVDCRGQ